MDLSSMDSSLEIAEAFRNPQQGAALLQKISLFSKLKLDELQRLYQKGSFIKARDKSNLVIEGDPTRGLYVLLKGTVSIYKNDPIRNAMLRLTHLESGSAFGELSLFDPWPRSATVIAETPCYLFFLSETAFSQFLDQEGENLQVRFYKKCAEEMVERFRSQNQDYVNSQLLLWQQAMQSPSEKASRSEKNEKNPTY
jgi:CRP/FNR family cyclic AMP-dependent transcriptional regulator